MEIKAIIIIRIIEERMEKNIQIIIIIAAIRPKCFRSTKAKIILEGKIKIFLCSHRMRFQKDS